MAKFKRVNLANKMFSYNEKNGKMPIIGPFPYIALRIVSAIASGCLLQKPGASSTTRAR